MVEGRRIDSSKALIVHLNVSLQNKFDELKLLNNSLKAHVLFVAETKIDRSNPNAQFHRQGYIMYCWDRAKGGGGLLAYFSSCTPSKKN